MKSIRSFFAMLAVWSLTLSAFAHDPGLSSANVTRANDAVKVTLTFAWPDLALLHAGATGSDIASIDAQPPVAFGPEWAPIAAEFVRVLTDGAQQPPTVPSL